jgi:hypothetical protein
MDSKAKLVELLKNIPQVNHYEAQVHGYDYVFGCAADFLIDSGVTIPVRCKDCARGEIYSNRPCYIFCMEHHRLVEKNDFCSYGERKDNE